MGEISINLHIFFLCVHVDVGQPVSSVYGVPVSTAMRLVKTLCQAGRNMAAILVSLVFSTSVSTICVCYVHMCLLGGGGRVVRRCCVSYITGASN